MTFDVGAVQDVAKPACGLRRLGWNVGMPLRPATPMESLWPALDLVDVVLIMSVNPGFSGQKFMPEVLPKAEAVKKRLRDNQRLEMDGGLHAATIRSARDAGVDWFVIGSGIFDQQDRAAAIAELRRKI